MEGNGFGPAIGIIIIVLLFIAGGVYFIITQQWEQQPTPIELPPVEEEAL